MPDPYPLDAASVAARLAALDCGPHEALKDRLQNGSLWMLAWGEEPAWAAEMGRIIDQAAAVDWPITA